MIPMPLYAILRFQKCKAGGVACRDRHNERKKVEYKSNPNIDLYRSKDNYHLIEPHGRYKDACTRMIGKAGCKVRSNSTVLVETLVTASPELLNRMTPKEQRQFFERAATFLYERIRLLCLDGPGLSGPVPGHSQLRHPPEAHPALPVPHGQGPQ